MGCNETLTVNAIGGLCNRMRAIAAAVSLARRTGRRPEVVWQANSELNAMFSDLFMPLPDGISLSHPGRIGYMLKWDIPRKRNLYLSDIYQRFGYTKVFREGGNLMRFHGRDNDFADEIAGTSGDILIITGTATGGCSDEEFRALFSPSERVGELLKEKTTGFNGHTVGVHIRRTDNAKSINGSPLGLFISEMEARIGRDRDTNFFVASDDTSVIDTLTDRFGERIIPGDRDATRTTLRGMLHGAADLWALSHTCEILGSYYSSYTDTAALLGDVHLSVVSSL